MYRLPPHFTWLPPWSPLEVGTISAELADELRREIPVGHVLADCQFIAVGQSERYDDFLFLTDSATKPIAMVHLTWKMERDPTWPFTVVYESLDAWTSEMKLDHVEFQLEQDSDGE